jgi:outer membrane protein TolC
VKQQRNAGQTPPLAVIAAEVELIEAQIRLAEAAGPSATVVAGLKKLVSTRTQERQLTEKQVQAGVQRSDALNQADARLANAKARLAKAEAAAPAEEK